MVARQHYPAVDNSCPSSPPLNNHKEKLKEQQQQHQQQHRPTYERFSRVLLLGEADFSFARALAQDCITHDKDKNKDKSKLKITATEYGTGQEICFRYFFDNGNEQALRRSLNALQAMAPMNEIISGLNARLLGSEDCTCQRWSSSSSSSLLNRDTGSIDDDNNKGSWSEPGPFWRSFRDTNNNNDDLDRSSSDQLDDYQQDMFDLVVFNFPHSPQAGRAARLLRALFKQVRVCVNDGRVSPRVVVELRLRRQEQQRHVRCLYRHEEAAALAQFTLLGCWDSDLAYWLELGYQHKWTKKSESCRDFVHNCQVWRWVAAPQQQHK